MICPEETLELLRAFSDATGMSVVFQPADLGRISSDPEGPDFCLSVCRQLGTHAPCHDALRRSIRDAAHFRKPQVIHCFAKLQHMVVPVFDSGRFVGSLLIGQIADQAHKKKRLAKIKKNLRAVGLDTGIKSLLKSYRRIPVTGRHRFEAAVKLASALSGQIAKTMMPEESQPGTQAYSVRQMMAFADRHFTKECRLADVAKHLGFNGAYLSRAFRAQNGSSFTQYVVRRRIEHAKDLLAKNHLRVLDISAACGFASLSQFNRAFKKETGMPPTAWRIRTP